MGQDEDKGKRIRIKTEKRVRGGKTAGGIGTRLEAIGNSEKKLVQGSEEDKPRRGTFPPKERARNTSTVPTTFLGLVN